MNTYELTVIVPVVTYNTHRVTVEADSPVMAALEVQSMKYDDTTMHKEGENTQAAAPYEIKSYRRVVNPEIENG